MSIEHFLKYSLRFICLSLLIIKAITQPVSGQTDSSKVKFARHIISIHETSDFNASEYGYDTKHPGNYPTKYAYYCHYPFNSLRGSYSYSVGLNYEYCLIKSLSVNTGCYFSKQAFELIETNPITYNDTTYPYSEYHVSYIYFPLGVKISFLNKFCIRPNVSIDLINALLLNEKAHISGNIYSVIPIINTLDISSNTFQYYFLKPQITVGCDFYIKKIIRLGVEMVWKGNAFYHTDKTFPTRFKYTNLNFGLSIGYVIK